MPSVASTWTRSRSTTTERPTVTNPMACFTSASLVPSLPCLFSIPRGAHNRDGEGDDGAAVQAQVPSGRGGARAKECRHPAARGHSGGHVPGGRGEREQRHACVLRRGRAAGFERATEALNATKPNRSCETSAAAEESS